MSVLDGKESGSSADVLADTRNGVVNPAKDELMVRARAALAWVSANRTITATLAILIIACAGLTLASHQAETSIQALESEAQALDQEILQMTADIEFAAVLEKTEAEIDALMIMPKLPLAEALASIGDYAQTYGLTSVNYEVTSNKELWRDDFRVLGETDLRMQIQSLHEGQVTGFLSALEQAWGGQLEVKMVEFSRGALEASEDSVEGAPIAMIQTEATVRWRRYWRPV